MIKKTVHKIPHDLPLRLGLAFVNIYAGYYLLTDPARYYKYVPAGLNTFLVNFSSVDFFLRVQGLGEIIIGMLIMSWFLKDKWAYLGASLLALEMLLIVAFIGLDGVTFRNVGLLGGAITLMLIHAQRPKFARRF